MWGNSRYIERSATPTSGHKSMMSEPLLKFITTTVEKGLGIGDGRWVVKIVVSGERRAVKLVSEQHTQ
jgi:hypothetical protein